MEPPSLIVIDSTLSDNLVAGAWLSGEGSYQFSDNTVSGGVGIPHGSATRCGDGVFARGVAAWDGNTGLLLNGNTVSGNTGAGLFLDDGWAVLDGNTWTGNDPDLWVQGEACLSPREDYAEAPTSTICPEWDRPTCDLAFTLELAIADIDPLPPPPVVPRLPLAPLSALPRIPAHLPALQFARPDRLDIPRPCPPDPGTP